MARNCIMYENSDSVPATKSAYKTLEKVIKARQHAGENTVEMIDLQRPGDYPGVIERGRMMFRGEEKSVYGFSDIEDLIVIVNVLPSWLQIEATHFSLHNCPEFPNSTNLGSHEVVFTDRVLQVWRQRMVS